MDEKLTKGNVRWYAYSLVLSSLIENKLDEAEVKAGIDRFIQLNIDNHNNLPESDNPDSLYEDYIQMFTHSYNYSKKLNNTLVMEDALFGIKMMKYTEEQLDKYPHFED